MEARRELQKLEQVWNYYENEDIKYKTVLNQLYEATTQVHLKLYFFMQLNRLGCFSIPENEDFITAGKNLEKIQTVLIKQLNEKPNKNVEELAVAMLANFYTENYVVGLGFLIAFIQDPQYLQISHYFKQDICEILYCLPNAYYFLPETLQISALKDGLFNLMKIDERDDLSLQKLKLNLLFISLSPLSYVGKFFYIQRGAVPPNPSHGRLRKIVDHLISVIEKSPHIVEIFPETRRQMDKKGIRERLKSFTFLYGTLYGEEKKPRLSFWRKSRSLPEDSKAAKAITKQLLNKR